MNNSCNIKGDCCNAREDALKQFDLIVIGAGSGGFSAAITASERDKSVLLVGYGTIGGTCVNVGCVPSKTLIRALDTLHHAKKEGQFDGIETHGKIIDWRSTIAQKQQLVDSLREAKYSNVLKQYPGITYLEGEAELTKTGITLNKQSYQADKIIIATGSSNIAPAINGLSEIDYLDSTSLLNLEVLPKSLLVIGGGVIGCEMAQAFSRADVEVTICTRSQLLPGSEPEISDTLSSIFKQQGVKVCLGVDYKNIAKKGSGYEVTFNDGTESIVVEKILISTGRKPNTDSLNCKQANVILNKKGGIEVNKYMQSSNPNIYAVGDVTGKDMLVYMAAYGAKLAVNNALDGNVIEYDASSMPTVVFTDPQVASVGFTDSQAKQLGFDTKVSVVPLSQVPRAIAARNTDGVIKLVADKKTDLLLGAHICAQEAGDSIQTAVMAIKNNMTTKELGETIFPYLTMVEGIKLAAQTFDKDIGKLSCCAG